MGRLTWRVATLRETVPETPRVKSLFFEVPEWQRHLPGQHVDIRLTAEDGYQVQRSYSIASAPEEERIGLTVERLEDGEVSPYLVDELREGDQVELRGPIGGYFVWHNGLGGPLLLVAGGSGVVPLMAMIRHRVAVGSDVETTLLFSSRSHEDIIYRSELDELGARGDGVKVVHTLTRSQPSDWNGYRRRVDAEMLGEVAFPPGAGAQAFICGPTAFVEAAAEALVGLGYPPERVKTERFGATGG